jgi:predicted enzyme involved in methoxymalonyl-ACP biosynthesis
MVERAQALGYKKIIGEYLPTPKNKMVETHYSKLGFQKIKGETAQYELYVDNYHLRKCYIKTAKDDNNTTC